MFHFTFEISLLVFIIVLWIFCCDLAVRKRALRREAQAEGWTWNNQSMYIIPACEEELGEQEVSHIYEGYFSFPYTAPPVYYSRNNSPPPPYMDQSPYPEPPPSYPDPPPSYTDPPAYSENHSQRSTPTSSTTP
ncbi:uncharacterized protein V6R79_023675 [Siganus canaliculatus]